MGPAEEVGRRESAGREDRHPRRRQAVRRGHGGGPRRAGRRRRRALHAAGPVGLRQDHPAAPARRLLPAGRWRDPLRRAEVVSGLAPYERNIGMVFQNYALWPHMTVAGNVAYGLRLRKLATAEVERRVREGLAKVNLGGLESRYPGQLSGGQQQRVALARALVLEPRHPAAGRAALEPRRQDPRAGARRDPQAPAGAGHHHHLRHPRPGGSALPFRSRRRHEGRARAAGGRAAGALRAAAHPLRGRLRGDQQSPARPGARAARRAPLRGDGARVGSRPFPTPPPPSPTAACSPSAPKTWPYSRRRRRLAQRRQRRGAGAWPSRRISAIPCVTTWRRAPGPSSKPMSAIPGITIPWRWAGR